MHPFLCSILDKPVCSIIDGCQNIYNKLADAVPSMLTPSNPNDCFPLKNSFTKVQKRLVEKPLPPKEPQNTEDVPISCTRLHPMNKIDYDSRNSCIPMKDKLTNGPGEQSPNKPNWLIAMDDISSSLIQVRKVRLSNEPSPTAQDDSNLFDSGVWVPEPPNQCKYLLRLWGVYPYPAVEDTEDDDYLLVDDDDDSDDDYL